MRFAPVMAATRLGLCAVEESVEVRSQHLAALLAWTPGMRLQDNRMVVEFDFAASAWWACEALDSADAEMAITRGSYAELVIRKPLVVLGRFGFRDGRWLFRHGHAAGLGIARGAVQAAGEFSRAGLEISCPNPAAMLTLVGVLRRMDVPAKPSEGRPRVSVASRSVPDVLERLGVPAAAEAYLQVRAATARTTRGGRS